MIYLGLFFTLLLASFAILLALAEAVIKLNDEDERPTEAISFSKLVVVAVYAVVLSLIFVAWGLNIWLVVLVSLLLVIGLSLVMQLLARNAGKTAWASNIVRIVSPLLKSINLFFKPQSHPRASSEE